MLKQISFALVAASLIAGPALAQGTSATGPAKVEATTPAGSVKTDTKADVKADTKAGIKADAKTDAKTDVKAKADKKSEAVQLKKAKHVRHVTKHKKVASKASAKPVRVTN